MKPDIEPLSSVHDATQELARWLAQWQARGGAARLSENEKRLVEGWLAAGADPNGLLGGGHKPLSALVAALPSPELCGLLIAHGAVAGRDFVEAVAQRCIGWTNTPISAAQRMARMDEQAQWRKFILAQMERWPELDWYAPCPWKKPDPRPRGLRKSMGEAPRPKHSWAPSARVIEHHIPGFTGRLEAARTRKGLHPGPRWTTQQAKSEALLDLLAENPELHSFSGRDRATQLRDVIDQGADLKTLAREALVLALALKQVDAMEALLERLDGVPSGFHQVLAEQLEALPAQSGLRQASMACWQALIEKPGLIDWTAMVAMQEGGMALGAVVDKKLDGLYSLIQASTMDARTPPGKRRARKTTRL